MSAFHQTIALVARAPSGPNQQESYLQMTSLGTPAWVDDPLSATAFASMREATRAAMRLPCNLRAFGLPRNVEVTLARAC